MSQVLVQEETQLSPIQEEYQSLSYLANVQDQRDKEILEQWFLGNLDTKEAIKKLEANIKRWYCSKHDSMEHGFYCPIYNTDNERLY